MRIPRLVTVALLAAGSLASWAPASAGAVVETCHGQPATIVGSAEGPGIRGTSGADVIVSNGESRVAAGAGNDLVCLTGTSRHGILQVDGDDGDDLIDATAEQPGLRRVNVSLDAGADTYLGSATEDLVDARDDIGTVDAVDTVATGAGDDEVTLGRKGLSTVDVISLGDGDDEVSLRGLPGATGRIAGDAGEDVVFLGERGRAAWTLDNRAEAMTARSATMPTTGFEEFRAFLRNSRSVRFRGSDRDETFEISSSGQEGDVDVAMGGGRDTVFVFGPYVRGTYHGGRGTDLFHLFGHVVSDRLIEKSQGGADLAAGAVWLGDERPRDHGQARIRSFADVLLDHFGDATVVGNDRGNRITVKACRSTVHAGGGADDVVFTAWAMAGCGRVSARRVLAYGEAGDDRLTGGIGRDVLDGGAGYDHADGGPHVDTCAAEVRKRC